MARPSSISAKRNVCPAILLYSYLAIALTGCGAKAPMRLTPTIERIVVAPDTATLALGQTVQLSATAVYTDGATANQTANAMWTSSNPSTVSVDASGLIHSHGIGTASISATVETWTGSASVTVTDAVPQSFSVSPAAVSLPEGETQQLKATATLTDGTHEDVTSAVAWRISDPSIIRISATGLLTAQKAGTSAFTASRGTLSASAQATVLPAALISISIHGDATHIPVGLSETLTARAVFSDGTQQELTSAVTWSSSAIAVLTVDPSGRVTARGAGTSTVTARSGSIAGHCTLTVSVAQLTSLTVSAQSSDMPVGTSQQLSALGTFTDGSTRDLTSNASWSSSSTAALTIDRSGKAIARSVGAATISARSGGILGSRPLTISAAQLRSILVSAPNSDMPAGTSQQLNVVGKYTDNSTRDLSSSVTWSSSSPAVLTIAQSGRTTARSIGTAIASARSGQIEGSTSLTVLPASMTALTVTALSFTMPSGTSQQLSAVGTYTDNSTRDLTGSVTWNSSAASVLTIAPSGWATAGKVGVSSVSAHFGGNVGSATITISAAQLTSLAILASGSDMEAGTFQQLRAVGTYTDSSTRDLTSQSLWSASTSQVAIVSSHGVVAALSAGTVDVSAKIGGIADILRLTVTPAGADLTSIAIEPDSPDILVGNGLRLAAMGTYSDGSVVDITGLVTWTVTDGTVLQINQDGMAVALQAGATPVTVQANGVLGGTSVTVDPAALVTYFSLSQTSDETLRISSTGTGTDGRSCAMIYVFREDQQMAECCGCSVSAGGLRTLSLNNDLLANPLTNTPATTGSLVLVASDQDGNATCEPDVTSPVKAGAAWSTHIQTAGATTTVTESVLKQTKISDSFLENIQAQCQFIHQLGSGRGLCTCGKGD